MRLKVCGMTSVDDMHRLGEMGVEFAGLIFYPKSPRFVLKHGLRGEDVKRAKLKVVKVGVFVNAPYDEIKNHIHNYGLDMIQLHGHESPYECAKLSDYIQTIKAFRFSENDHVEWTIKDFYNDTDLFMFDTGVPVAKEEREHTGLYGGTGRKFNWNRLRGLDIGKPFFLSGGIEPTDAQLVKEFMKDPVAKDLFAVDINSRFEISPGVKDLEKVGLFMEELKET